MNGKGMTSAFKIAAASAALFCVAALAYLVGLRQISAGAAVPEKTYVIELGGLHVRLTAGVLTILLVVAILLALIARRQAKKALATNRKLEIEIRERKRAEEALRESEERLQTVTDNLAEGLIISNIDGQLIYWNRAGIVMHGYGSLEECLRKLPEFADTFELATLDGVVLSIDQWPLARVLGGEHLRDFEVRVWHRHAQWRRVFSYSGDIVHDASGKPLAFLAINDITERKQSEEALRKTSERLRLAQQVARVGTFEWNIQTGENQWTPEIEAMYGLPPGGFAGTQQTWENLVHPEDRAEAARRVSLAMESGNFEDEWRAIWPDGTVRWLAGRASVFKDDSGKPLRLVGVNIDITERKQAEEELRRSQAQLAGVIGSAMDAIISVDGKQQVVLFNAAAERMFRCPANEAIGQTLDRFIPERFRSTHHGHIQAFGRTKVTRRSMGALSPIFGLRTDGEEFPIEASISQLELEGQKLFTVILRDITERRRAEEEVSRLNENLERRVADRTAQLQAANKELEAFSYSVSHDLRAPLRAIDGFSVALLEDCADKLDEEGKGYLEQVRGASQEMAQLIDALLHLARVTRSEMRQETISLSQLAQAVVSELRKRGPEREIAIHIQEGLTAQGDKRLLQVLLNNLLGNAWKFTSKLEHPEIMFGQQQKDAETSYFVRDNGAGFDMAYANKLFGAFQRLHGASEFEGTGIGLATVQRIVHRHGGRVWAEGAVDRGATFYFTLPDMKEMNHGEQSDLTG
jgi:PAS domain S-box-containing protein